MALAIWDFFVAASPVVAALGTVAEVVGGSQLLWAGSKSLREKPKG